MLIISMHAGASGRGGCMLSSSRCLRPAVLPLRSRAISQVFRGMGVLDVSKPDLRRPGVEEPFSVAIKRCMMGGAADAPDAESAAPSRKKLVQGDDGGDRRRAFGQLYEELSELAFRYYFTIPSCDARTLHARAACAPASPHCAVRIAPSPVSSYAVADTDQVLTAFACRG